MHYNRYSIEDFVLDEYFQQWVYSPDDESSLYWERFLIAHPEQQNAVDEARAFLESMRSRESGLADDVPEGMIQAIKKRFNREVDRRELHADRARSVQSRELGRSYRKVFYLAAASVLLVASLLGFVILKSDTPVSFLAAFSMEQQETSNGGVRHIVLSDGTQVWINASSRLQYPTDFANRELREVYLEGEAFFDVYEDREKPFVVRTSDVSISVMGTTFNVKSYATDHFVETTLVTGKVTIESDQDDSLPVTLRPNQQALFSKESRKIELKNLASMENFTEWRNGWIVFDDQPFSQIRKTLERWYNVTIDVEDPKSLSCTFSGKFKDKTLEEILEIFSHTVPIRYQFDGSRVLIQGQLCMY